MEKPLTAKQFNNKATAVFAGLCRRIAKDSRWSKWPIVAVTGNTTRDEKTAVISQVKATQGVVAVPSPIRVERER